MKVFLSFLLLLILSSCVSGKESNYTGSTPAGPLVRLFLGIASSDSIDFIRWKIKIRDNAYSLQCNYGIGKPNTNGFYNGGNTIELNGPLNREKNIVRLLNGSQPLKLIELNQDLLHILNADNSLMTGNQGWSYTLCNLLPSGSDQVNITAARTGWKDSLVFGGRTPCGVPGIIPPGTLCYKLKWYLVLYGDPGGKGGGTYKIFGTPYRKAGGKKGNWEITTGKNGRVVYQLNEEDGKGFIYLLKLDENILVFTDAGGKLLVGDGDFSYTLNREYSSAAQ